MIPQLATTSLPVPMPLPRVDVTIRPGVSSDVPFLDALQKLHTKQVGWMPTAQFEGKIKLGHVLIAEEVRGQKSEVSDNPASSSLTSDLRPLTSVPVGYCIGTDQYFKRDDVGIICQMNVVPGRQRGLVGATLLKAMFDRAAYGCKLFCCWCAQDIEANRFWESMGFVPLAFRAGSAAKSRVHIFWQKRIREGDEGGGATPWWFPSQTSSGSIREDRIVLPIPPGTHWSDAKPLVLPTAGVPGDPVGEQVKQLPLRAPRTKPKGAKAEPIKTIKSGGLRMSFEPIPEPVADKPKREPKQKVKNDPRLVAAARELRDRWLEQVNDEGFALPAGKYDVSRALTRPNPARMPMPLLENAA